MTSTTADDDRELHPIQALNHLANVITTLDSMLDEKNIRPEMVPAQRRIIYVRNTLCVTLDLWQDDVRRRLMRSKNGFYIYSMTDAERTGFLRRIEPSLRFAAEELRNIHIASMSHLIDMIEQAASDILVYAANNRQSILLGMEGLEGEPPLFFHATKTLPSEQEIRLLAMKTASS
jgi:hypothetical protein